MKKYILSGLLSFTLLAGCAAPDGTNVPDETDTLYPVQDATEPVQDTPGDVTISELSTETVQNAEEGYAAFAVELLRQSRSEGKNTLVSPLSVTLALGMTANGAAGDTLTAFENLFGMDIDTLNIYAAHALETYAALGGSTEATLVNSLWYDPDLTLTDTFTARCQQNYGAEFCQADLQDAATVNLVNQWISTATKGLIPKTTDRFSPDAVLALVNAIYLKNQFARPFATPHSEWTMNFTATDGTVSHPKGMSNGERKDLYLYDEKGQGVILPYDDGQLGFLLMLPEENMSLDDYLSGWTGMTVKNLLDAQEERLMILTVPKYEIEWSDSLADMLKNMGLADAFDVNAAEFSAMGTSPNGPLFIGDVIHKTVLKVNEKGTEAAAVTVVSMTAGAVMPPDDLVILTFDRPFVCGIVDLETGAPLFLGTVEALPD